MTDSADITDRMQSILNYVQDCQRRVHMGEIMDLNGLDNTVVDICNDIAAMPPEEARAMEDRMTKLIDSLEELAGAMREQQEKIDSGAR